MREREHRTRMPLLVPTSHRHLFRQRHELPTAVKATLRHCARSEPPLSHGDVRTAVGLSRGSLVENAPAKGSTAKPAPGGSLTGTAGVDGSVSLLRSRSFPAPHACMDGWMQQAFMQVYVRGWFVRRFPLHCVGEPESNIGENKGRRHSHTGDRRMQIRVSVTASLSSLGPVAIR